MNPKEIYIHRIATVVPEKFYTQEFSLMFLLKLMGDTPEKREFLTKLYQGSAIYKRHSVITDYDKDPSEYQFYPKNPAMLPEPDSEARNEVFIREANRLSLAVVTKLLDELPGFDKKRITHLITVSCTGFSAPGFDLHIIKKLSLPPHINRYHLGFMGCYAAFPAMKLAKDICLAHPEAKVLVVNTELCTLHFQQNFDLEIVISNSLFADGVSAALISADIEDSHGSKIILRDFYSHYLANSEDKMAWSLGRHGFNMKLSAYVPGLINENIVPVMADLFKRADIKQADIDIWAIHPGGKAILKKLEKTLNLSPDDLHISYQVLRDFGNMSSATIMFVLAKIMECDRYGKIFSAAFGPGLSLETGYMEKVTC
jgi:predicted naringenin-chalcone synthase